MGANMARRLKECGYEIAAVYDVNAAAAQALAQELGCPAAERVAAGHEALRCRHHGGDATMRR